VVFIAEFYCIEFVLESTADVIFIVI